jgi:glycogen phosphorylase
VEAVRRHCVFTTHTPVPAGHDQFPWELVRQVLGPERADLLRATGCCIQENLNMTYLALRCARYINGVAMRHGEISLGMFPGYPINAISNGVHAVTWTSPAVSPHCLTGASRNGARTIFTCATPLALPSTKSPKPMPRPNELCWPRWRKQSGVRLPEPTLTIGFARRATAYKRPDLLFYDLGRLKAMALRVGPLQVIYGGKAHPRDEGGKEMIRRVFGAARALGEDVKIVYLENYDMALGKILCAGVDLWLNTPLRPQEASGTSGMKAALNGVPSLSILDGWWVEGHVEHVTGWAIGGDSGNPVEFSQDAASLYDKLEQVILPLFYGKPEAYDRVRRSAIALNGSFFNTQRMVAQYLANAYVPNNWK